MKKCIICGAKFDSIGWKCPACQAAPALIDEYPAFSSGSAAATGGFRADYFTQLAGLEPGNFWFCSRNRLIILAIKKYFSNAGNFLEIGCGTGFVLSAIQNAFPLFSLYGSDIFTEGLKFAKQRLQNATLLQMDARNIPFENEFDVIGAFDILEHIKDDGLVLSQMYSATRKGGGIILTVPQHSFLWSQFDDASCHIRRYDAKELYRKVTEAGFRIVDSISFMSLPFLLMLISRLKKKAYSAKYDIMADINVRGITNTVLKKVLDCERCLINFGMRFPFGGSLLLIARKVS